MDVRIDEEEDPHWDEQVGLRLTPTLIIISIIIIMVKKYLITFLGFVPYPHPHVIPLQQNQQVTVAAAPSMRSLLCRALCVVGSTYPELRLCTKDNNL